MSQLSVSYLVSGRYLSIEELRNDPSFQQLASFAAMVSDVDFLICDVEGHVLLSTDQRLDGRVVTMPEDMTRGIMEKGSSARRDNLDGLYETKQFIMGVPAVNPETQEIVGEVFGVSAMTSLDAMWRGFVGLFFMTAFVSLMIAFMSSSITAMRQVKPIREMAQAPRQNAVADYDFRMREYARGSELKQK